MRIFLLPFFFAFAIPALQAQIEVSEINYNSDSTLNAGNWVELHNKGTTSIQLAGWIITDAQPSHIFTFPINQVLGPDDYLVVSDDTTKFKHLHPSVTNVIGEVPFGWSNNSDTITIYDDNGAVVYNMAYWDSSPWQKTADGMGRTLELRNSSADPALPESWFAGCMGGSPGRAYSPCQDPVTFTEINYHSLPQLDARDWVELHNRTAAAIDMSGWQLKDKEDTNVYTFPTATVLPPDGYVVVVADTQFFNTVYPSVTNRIGNLGFHLSNSGDGIRLFNVQTGQLQYSLIYNDKSPWPEAADGQGYTLELIDETGIVNDGDNWMAGCLGGSPGRAYDLACGTGLPQLPVQVDFEIVENPVIEQLIFDYDPPASLPAAPALTVWDVLGKAVSDRYPVQPGRNALWLGQLSKGVYFAVLTNGSITAVRKFVIE